MLLLVAGLGMESPDTALQTMLADLRTLWLALQFSFRLSLSRAVAAAPAAGGSSLTLWAAVVATRSTLRIYMI